MTNWIDTHAHLCDAQFDADRPDAIERAFRAGVATILEIADGPSEWEKAKNLSETYPGKIVWAAGLHPYFAEEGTEDHLDRLRDLAQHPSFVAVGEIGLDYAKCAVPKDIQKRTFDRCLDLAHDAGKPVIIHCRDAFDDLHPILDSKVFPERPGVVHCFSGTQDDADKILSKGFYLGVDGPLTYPNSHPLREVFQSVPVEKILLETDSPYLPPQPYRGKRNEPANLPIIGDELARLRKMDGENLRLILSRNFHALFSISSR